MLCPSFTEAMSAAFEKRLSEGFPENHSHSATNVCSTASLSTGKELAVASNIKTLEVCRPVLTWHHVRAPILSTARGDEQAAGFPLSPLTHTMLIKKLRETAGYLCVS